MIRIVNFINRRKAWQIFAALIAPLLVFQLCLSSTMPGNVGRPGSVVEMDQMIRATMIGALLMTLLLLSWLVSIGWAANQRIEAVRRPKLRWYFAAAVYAPIYIAFATQFFRHCPQVE